MGGSSPRIRGTLGSQCLRVADGRLIPAHTGNTRRQHRLDKNTAAHPRTYGEHFPSIEERAVCLGSSPHIRGTPRYSADYAAAVRLIPAHTGNTTEPSLKRATTAAHPRTYGEHVYGRGLPCTRNGSSPHIRGTHSATRHDTQPKTKKYSVSTRI